MTDETFGITAAAEAFAKAREQVLQITTSSDDEAASKENTKVMASEENKAETLKSGESTNPSRDSSAERETTKSDKSEQASPSDANPPKEDSASCEEQTESDKKQNDPPGDVSMVAAKQVEYQVKVALEPRSTAMSTKKSNQPPQSVIAKAKKNNRALKESRVLPNSTNGELHNANELRSLPGAWPTSPTGRVGCSNSLLSVSNADVEVVVSQEATVMPHPVAGIFNGTTLAVAAEVVDKDDKEEEDDTRRSRRPLWVAMTFVVSLVVVGTVVGFVVLGSSSSSKSTNGTVTVIAQVPQDICYDRIPGQGRSTLCTVEEMPQGSGVSNMVAKSRLDQIHSADISILNAGEVKVDIPAGSFNEEDIKPLLPFDNELVELMLTGEMIVSALEQSLLFLISRNKTGAYPYASGLRFDVDFSGEFPNRFSNVQVNPRLDGEWTLIDVNRTYAVVTNAYLASGGDGYEAFTTAKESRNLFTTAETSFKNYCVNRQQLIGPDLEEYSTQNFYVAPEFLLEFPIYGI